MDTTKPLALRELHRGMSYGYLARRGAFATDEALRQPEEMAALGIRWVALQVTVMQDAFASTRLYQDFLFTPSDTEVETLIGRFHACGIRVMLKPMVECHDSSWRGRIAFPDGDQQIQGRVGDYWARWFESFTQALTHYGRMAQRTGCEMLCLGCEMTGTIGQEARWRQTVGAVRAVYGGALTYDANNHDECGTPWFDALDVVSFSFYPTLDVPAGATADQMTAALAPVRDTLRQKAAKLGKPLAFGECGCRSIVGGARVPWEYRNQAPYDGAEQANFLEAVLRTFWNEPWWQGFYWWKWDEQQDRPHYRADPAGDGGFTLRGKPAADVMRAWFTRPNAR